jgi:hypothetical protein
MQIAFPITIPNLSSHALALIDDCRRSSGLGVALYDTNDRPGGPVRVGFLKPRADTKRVYTDTN